MKAESVLSTIEHPHDSVGVLNWLLWHWEADIEAPLLVLTPDHTGAALVNRVRAQLSIARREIKSGHGKLAMEFGFHHKTFPWETLGGVRYEAVAFMPFQSRRHKFRQIMGDFPTAPRVKFDNH